MSNSKPQPLHDRPPNWLRRLTTAPRPTPRDRARDNGLLEHDIREIASAAPMPVAPTQSFTEKFEEFMKGADRITQENIDMTERLRLALARCAVLERLNEDQAQHIADLNAYWQAEVEHVGNRIRTLQRLYYAVTGGIDTLVDSAIQLRSRAREEAYAPDESMPPLRGDVHSAQPHKPLTENEVEDLDRAMQAIHGANPDRPEPPMAGAHRTKDHLPPPNYGHPEHRRRDLDIPRDRAGQESQG